MFLLKNHNFPIKTYLFLLVFAIKTLVTRASALIPLVGSTNGSPDNHELDIQSAESSKYVLIAETNMKQ